MHNLCWSIGWSECHRTQTILELIYFESGSSSSAQRALVCSRSVRATNINHISCVSSSFIVQLRSLRLTSSTSPVRSQNSIYAFSVTHCVHRLDSHTEFIVWTRLEARECERAAILLNVINYTNRSPMAPFSRSLVAHPSNEKHKYLPAFSRRAKWSECVPPIAF